jgi:hypothetical protein
VCNESFNKGLNIRARGCGSAIGALLKDGDKCGRLGNEAEGVGHKTESSEAWMRAEFRKGSAAFGTAAIGSNGAKVLQCAERFGKGR